MSELGFYALVGAISAVFIGLWVWSIIKSKGIVR